MIKLSVFNKLGSFNKFTKLNKDFREFDDKLIIPTFSSYSVADLNNKYWRDQNNIILRLLNLIISKK